MRKRERSFIKNTKLKEMFQAIGKDNLYIASKGVKKQIIKVLEYVGLGDYVNNEHITGGEGTGIERKVNVLNRLFVNNNIFCSAFV